MFLLDPHFGPWKHHKSRISIPLESPWKIPGEKNEICTDINIHVHCTTTDIPVPLACLKGVHVGIFWIQYDFKMDNCALCANGHSGWCHFVYKVKLHTCTIILSLSLPTCDQGVYSEHYIVLKIKLKPW